MRTFETFVTALSALFATDNWSPRKRVYRVETLEVLALIGDPYLANFRKNIPFTLTGCRIC
jgi:hypothetical protein